MCKKKLIGWKKYWRRAIWMRWSSSMITRGRDLRSLLVWWNSVGDFSRRCPRWEATRVWTAREAVDAISILWEERFRLSWWNLKKVLWRIASWKSHLLSSYTRWIATRLSVQNRDRNELQAGADGHVWCYVGLEAAQQDDIESLCSLRCKGL